MDETNVTFSKKQLALLRTLFPVADTLWTPDSTIEQLAHAAGAQAVLRVIERRVPKES